MAAPQERVVPGAELWRDDYPGKCRGFFAKEEVVRVKTPKIEIISRIIAERLEAHAKVIHTLIVAQRRGAAEQFGYAFLAGRALLQAKGIVPNGNAKAAHAGFRKWVEANFPEITIRTAENWMRFAESIISRAQVDTATAPLLLGAMEFSGASHDSILKLVPQVMDGKGMMRFMRECRLLNPLAQRAPRRRKRLSAAEVRRKKAARARRFWEKIISDLGAGEQIVEHLESAADLKRYFEVLSEAGKAIGDVLKCRS
jgi:hypothetical protein